jgi:hypothetical protein
VVEIISQMIYQYLSISLYISFVDFLYKQMIFTVYTTLRPKHVKIINSGKICNNIRSNTMQQNTF